MLTKDQILKAIDGAEIVANALGGSATELLRKALEPERESPQPNNPPRLMVMKRSAA